MAEAWTPGSTYVIEIDSIRNANGAGADIRGPLEVPDAKADTTAAPSDSTRAPADSTPTAPDSTRTAGAQARLAAAGAAKPMIDDPRRQLPSVDRLLQEPAVSRLLDAMPRSVVVAAAREAVAVARNGRSEVPEDWAADVTERANRIGRRSLRPVLNATGVVLHTNLGRAPLARTAVEAVAAVASGYSALEFDLEAGVRGHRTDHGRRLLAELTGAEDALVVNNAASALVVALNTVAAGKEVVISRGELVEIGGSFRIPDILARSGARLREVGTTNRTHLDDYRRALGPATGAILKVHQSNFAQIGIRPRARAGRSWPGSPASTGCRCCTTSAAGCWPTCRPSG